MENEGLQVSIDIASGFVAFLALIFAVYSFKAQQVRAERLAAANVRPILKVRSLKYNNRKSIILINQGIGPAIVSRANFRKNDKATNNIVDLFDLPIKSWESFINVPDDTVIRASDERISALLTIKHLLKVNRNSRDEALGILKEWQLQKSGIEVEVRYTDILGNDQPPLKVVLK